MSKSNADIICPHCGADLRTASECESHLIAAHGYTVAAGGVASRRLAACSRRVKTVSDAPEWPSVAEPALTPIDCGHGVTGLVTRRLGTWESAEFGASPTVHVYVAGVVYRHVYAAVMADGTLRAVRGLPEQMVAGKGAAA